MTAAPSQHRAFLLTPPGAGAIAVIRVEGADPRGVLSAMFRSVRGVPLPDAGPGRIVFGQLIEGDEVIDDVLIGIGTAHERQCVADVSCHGGTRVVERILRALETRGVAMGDSADAAARVWPAENRIEREAIDAAAEAKTLRAVEFAARMRSTLPARIAELADLFLVDQSTARDGLQALLARASAAKILLEGATVVLIGPPNSGKSTLFNRLAGREAAITSPRPGTTRDWVSEEIEIDGIPITLIDTAGRHETMDELENLAIHRGAERAEQATLRVLVLDGTKPASEIQHMVGHVDCDLVIVNKSDLLSHEQRTAVERLQTIRGKRVAFFSALIGDEMSRVTHPILLTLGAASLSVDQPSLFTTRQVEVAVKALASPTLPEAFNALRNELLGGRVDSGHP